MKKKKKKSGLTMALTTGGEPVIVGTKFKDWLVHREEMAKEGNAYLRQSGPDWKSTEKAINKANLIASAASGTPNYEPLNRDRKKLLADIEKKRPLRRSEFIDLYGYQAWLDYVKEHDLPEDHKFADAHR